MSAALRQIIPMQPSPKLPPSAEPLAGIVNNVTEEWAIYGCEYGNNLIIIYNCR